MFQSERIKFICLNCISKNPSTHYLKPVPELGFQISTGWLHIKARIQKTVALKKRTESKICNLQNKKKILFQSEQIKFIYLVGLLTGLIIHCNSR